MRKPRNPREVALQEDFVPSTRHCFLIAEDAENTEISDQAQNHLLKWNEYLSHY